ncbi:hypothetical protein AB4212_67000, partial [Streptomyces sp. 2MCAF27]
IDVCSGDLPGLTGATPKLGADDRHGDELNQSDNIRSTTDDAEQLATAWHFSSTALREQISE